MESQRGATRTAAHGACRRGRGLGSCRCFEPSPRCGLKVVEAVSAEEGLELLRARLDINAVFADVVLPGRHSGADLAHIVGDGYPKVKVLLTSGVLPFPDVEGVHLLKKPYFPFEVERHLKSMLGLSAGRPR
jgi:CheY-like chemotaxis protein